jgi:isoquinoline 1-oxidoreductase beta subunit
MTVPTDFKRKDKANYKLIGKGATRVDNPAVVNGTAMYGIDAKVDGMVYAVIARKPAFGALLESADYAEARKVPGVLDVLKVGSGVAVIATNTWNAIKGREALKINWNMGPNAELDSAKVSAALHAAVGPHMDLPAGAKTIEATYELPFLAHATMEPMNALADVRDDGCTIWTGTQSPDGAQGQVAQRLGIPREKVVVNVMLLGGGFGRRLANEYAVEAAEISQAIKKPVKLLWTRDDDMRHDNYRPAGFHSLKGVLDASGKPIGWSHQAVTSGGRAAASQFRETRVAYDIATAGMRNAGGGVPVPTGAWRSVENTLNNVANECFIDELAHAAGKDPFEYRRQLIKDERLRKVLETAAEKADWGKSLPAGHGRGIACFAGYGSYAAHVMEVSVQGKKVKVHRAICVIDCGMAINPKGVEAQMQGACTDGLSTALRAAITIEKGGVKESSWFDYQWMTIDAMPKVEVYILENGTEPGGMGEPGYPSVAPAMANAVFAATGKRVRKFPIKVDELV